MHVTKTNTCENTITIKEQLIEGLLELAANMKNAGFEKELFTAADISSPTWSIFDEMGGVQQKKILSDFQVYADLMNSVIAVNKDFTENSSTLWAAIKSLGVLPSSYLFTNLEPDDVVEIYRNDSLQVFRNMRFHNVCSYHLHDLFIRSWPDLFVRDENLTLEIQKKAMRVFQGETVDIDTKLDYRARHNLYEKDSPGGYVLDMYLRFIEPLKDKHGNILYIVAVSKVDVVDKKNVVQMPELNL